MFNYYTTHTIIINYQFNIRLQSSSSVNSKNGKRNKPEIKFMAKQLSRHIYIFVFFFFLSLYFSTPCRLLRAFKCAMKEIQSEQPCDILWFLFLRKKTAWTCHSIVTRFLLLFPFSHFIFIHIHFLLLFNLYVNVTLANAMRLFFSV